MRDRVSDRTFLLQKRLENRIENALPDKFRSRYAMVCYGGAGNVTYRNAFILGKIQVTQLLFIDAQNASPHHHYALHAPKSEILKELAADAALELEAIPDDTWGDSIQRLADGISLEAAEKLIDERLAPLQRELGIDLATVTHH